MLPNTMGCHIPVLHIMFQSATNRNDYLRLYARLRIQLNTRSARLKSKTCITTLFLGRMFLIPCIGGYSDVTVSSAFAYCNVYTGMS